MNGYTKSSTVHERIANLIEQIPMPYRCQIVADCMPMTGNPHDLERNLTGAVLRKAWNDVNPDTTLRTIANEIGVTAVHVFDGNDLHDDRETVTNLTRAAYMEAPEPDWMTEARALEADAKDLQQTQEWAK